MNHYYLYRAAYEWPRTGRRGRFTLAARSDEALPMAAEWVKKFTGGYLLSLVEVKPLETNLELL